MSKKPRIFEDSSAFSEDNASFIDMLYQQYLNDPLKVEPDWRERFSALNDNAQKPFHEADKSPSLPRVATTALTSSAIEQAVRKQSAVDRLIEQYRLRGHHAAHNNPLKPNEPAIRLDRELDPRRHGLTDEDMDSLFYTDSLNSASKLSLRDIITHLKTCYCGNIGVEYRHIADAEISLWLQNRLENRTHPPHKDLVKQHWVLEQLIAAEGLEQHLHRKYVGQKRFSLEGAESLIPLLDELIQRCGSQGSREVVLGMAHRGRLNVLVNIMGRKMSDLFKDFEGNHVSAPISGTGDVKYHIGYSSDVDTPGGPVHLALAFNPSHLEIISPVVEGSVRARQDRLKTEAETAVVPVLIHGDAAFAGQGVVMETLNMAETRAYTTGGTLHIVINNQIGFTTSNTFDARSTLYCTDVAYMVQAPVLHVNGDAPEDVLWVTQLAVDYRMKFKRDIVIDLLCYRRHGHNEADEPAVTQPLMYRFINQHPSASKIYADYLLENKLLTPEQLQAMHAKCQERLEAGNYLTRTPATAAASSYTLQHWTQHAKSQHPGPVVTTTTPELYALAAAALLHLPENFTLHPRAAAIMENRAAMARGTQPIDWGFAENLAYASLLLQGQNIRISGQDVGRGTFFHRHAILYDQASGNPWVPLQHVRAGSGRFHIYDSLLSEEGVLGFEYGYSSSEPETLVIWEAQFGDFANNAQVVVDQFIAAGETKWGRLSGLTLLLPHGYEGQGPEHSSARIERYLQLCAEDNMQVCIPTSPAQIFHLLRRQHLQPFRKPLIVMTPKSLLRHKDAVSSIDELLNGRFDLIKKDAYPIDALKVERIILCSGKVFYDLDMARRDLQLTNIAIIRIEQLYPFPTDELREALQYYPNKREVIWCQEEPENQGAWQPIRQRIINLLEGSCLFGYAGRPRSAAPAVGQFQQHQLQQKALVAQALTGDMILFQNHRSH